MPEISRFFGIVIQMYFDDHNPPHIHARSGSDRARFRLDPIGKMDGSLPKQHLALVLKWARLDEADLLENWRRLRTQEPPLRIAPLE